MKFKCTNFFGRVSVFSEHDAPDWLTCADQVPSSTMDNSWFFMDHVLTLSVGESVETESSIIERIE